MLIARTGVFPIFLVLFAAFTQAGSFAMAAGPSSETCRQIQAQFQFWPDECEGRSDVSVVPTQEQRENHVFFPNGGKSLDAEAFDQLNQISQIMNGTLMANSCLLLIGHSDTSGSEEANLTLARSRAEAVAELLTPRLLGQGRVGVGPSAGEAAPLPNLPSNSRWQRRVEILARSCHQS